jgi:hypothetical protein
VVTGPDKLLQSLKFLFILLAASGTFLSPVGNPETVLILLLCILVAIVVTFSHGNAKPKTLLVSLDGTIRWQIEENQWLDGNLCPESWATSQYAVIGVEQDGHTNRMIISRSLQGNHDFRALLSNLKLLRLEGQ